MAFERITPGQAKHDVTNNNALLVNGYDDPQKWESTRVAPTATRATLPAAVACTRYGTPALASAAVATSQEWLNAFLPTGSNWNEQVAGSACTTTGCAAAACSIAGLA